MSLRWQIIAIVLAMAIVIVGTIVTASRLTFMRAFDQVERQNAAEMVERANSALQDRVKSLNTLNHDWAAWDDTYNFVQRPAENQNWIEVNPTDTTFASAGLNFMFVIDNTDQIVFGKGFNLETGEAMPIPDTVQKLVLNPGLTTHRSVDDGMSGVVLVPEGPLLISCQPVITSQGQGPVAGTIIMAQFLDVAVVADLSDTIRLPLAAASIENVDMAPDLAGALTSLSVQEPVLTRAVDSRTIAGYLLLPDIYGKPAVVLGISMPRDIHVQSVTTLRYFTISILLLVVLVGGALFFLMGKLVLSRVTHIARFASGIGISGDITQRLAMKGSDELSKLGSDLNGMVDTLQKAQQSLELRQRSEETLRLTIESVVDGIATTDLQGTITQANEAAVSVFGCSGKADLIGASVYRYIAEEDHAMTRKRLAATLTGGLVAVSEYTGVRKDESRFPAELSIAPLRDANGNPIGFVASARDITRRKQAEASVLAQKDLIDRILATTPNAVLVVNKDAEVVLANRAFYDAFALKQDGVIGMQLSEIMPSKELSDTVAEARSGTAPGLRLEFKRRSGNSDRIIVVSILTMQEETLLLFTDVTDERARQERLALTDRLASVGEMAAGVAHELNNPLTSVIGLSQLLLDEKLPDAVKEDLGIIYSEAQRAAAVVKNMLTFARKHASTRQATQITRVIDDVMKLRSYDQRVNNIQVNQIKGEVPDIMVDYFQMQQVFLNLTLNAEQAMVEAHGGGSLTITTERVNGFVRVSFSDDGPGIAPENLLRLFDPFFTTKEVGKGTGLGLSICYGIVKNHGGQIYARSEFGHGATFVIELPAGLLTKGDEQDER